MTKTERAQAHSDLQHALRAIDDPQTVKPDLIGTARKKNRASGAALEAATYFCTNYGTQYIKEQVTKLAPIMLDIILDAKAEVDERIEAHELSTKS